jgi:hypothetical protein
MSPAARNLIAWEAAKLFLCFSRLKVKYFQLEAVQTNQGHFRFQSQVGSPEPHLGGATKLFLCILELEVKFFQLEVNQSSLPIMETGPKLH